jgi:hypothetical protein
MLTAAEDAQLEGVISRPDEALEFVRERFGEPESAGQVRS